LNLLDERIVEHAFPNTSILSTKDSSGRSASTVRTTLGLDSKCF